MKKEVFLDHHDKRYDLSLLGGMLSNVGIDGIPQNIRKSRWHLS
jgi:hypothetical protein